MSNEPLLRTTYRDPTSTGNPIRTGAVSNSDAARDMDEYYRRLERTHGSNLHGWGVASGLAVTATLNQPGLSIQPGVAVDATGRHVCLAEGSSAEIGRDADAPGTPPTLTPVGSAGIVFPTAGLSSDKYLTLEFRETFDSSANAGSGVFQFSHTPWVRLIDVTAFVNDGARIVLARVKLGSGPDTGKVQSLLSEHRRGTEVSGEVLHVARQQAGTPPELSVGEAQAATLQPRTAGGLAVVADAVGFQAANGAEFGALQPRTAGGLAVVADAVGFQTANGAEFGALQPRAAGGLTVIASAVAFKAKAGVETVVMNLAAGNLALSGAEMILNAPRIAAGAVAPGFQLDVGNRMRVREGSDGSAGIWLFQKGPGNDRAFVGMANDHQVGFWGNTGAQWGFSMDTTTGAVSVASSLGVNGALAAGSATISGDLTVGNAVNAPQVVTTKITTKAVNLHDVNSFNAPLEGTIGLRCLTVAVQKDLKVNGNLRVDGSISKGSGAFQIDHPLDPANKYLSHSFVESPDMLNVYNGNVITDEAGEAVVFLPAYFQALNRDFRYQLTVLGGFAQATIAQEIHDNCFTIKTDRPRVKVSWLVTGVRQDPFARVHPIVVEQSKPRHERGQYLHPEAYGKPVTDGMANCDSLVNP